MAIFCNCNFHKKKKKKKKKHYQLLLRENWSAEICCGSHGQRKNLLEGNSVVR